jgi:DNA-binding ferritin-like protein
MAISAEELNVILTARTREFQKEMRAAERRVEYFKNKSNKNLGAVSKSFAGLSSAVRVLGPLLAGAFTIGTINRLVNGAAKIGELSDIAGVGVVEFQRFAVGAKTVGFEMDKVADILKDVNDKVGDFIATGGGPMKDFFENIAPAVGVTAEQFAKLSGPEALQLYVDSLEKANLSQAEMTFYMEALANDATALLPVLRNGGREMKELGDEAERTGRILDGDAVDGARELKIKAQELSDAISTQLTKAILDNETELRALVSFITDYAIPAFSGLISGIGEAIRLYNVARGIGPRNAKSENTSPAPEYLTTPPIIGDGEYAVTPSFDDIYGDEPVDLQEIVIDSDKPSPIRPKKKSGGGKSAADEVKELAEEYRDLIGQLDEAIGAQQDFEDTQKMLNDALARGAINQEQFNTALSMAKGELAAAKLEASGFSEVLSSIESGMEDAFMSMVDGTGDAKDAFKSMAADIIKELYRVLVVQQLVGQFKSGGGGILGALAGGLLGGPGKASGGAVMAGQAYTVGEHGREPFIPAENGRILSTAQAKAAIGGGQSQPVQVVYNFQGGVTEADLGRAMPMLVERTKREVVDAVQRGGSVARVFK